jgi:hypothetical protein
MVHFQIAIYPHGVTANHFPSLGEAVKTARLLEAVGHTIESISRGSDIYASGRTLRDLLGEKKPDTFRNFPVADC